MSQKTIECRLYAHSDSLRFLWELMSENNTPLINELLYQVSQHEEFDKWFKIKKISQKPIKDVCKPLRDLPQYQNQPGRFFTSAIALTHYIYKSWFAVQARLQRKIEGKRRWLNILKSDAELEAISESNIDQIIEQAQKILQEAENNSESTKKEKKKQGKKDDDLFRYFMNEYELRTDTLDRCAIAYLLKNQCRIADEIEDLKKFQQYRRKKEIEIERLQQQLENRLPQGRDLTADKWLETLAIASEKVPETEQEASAWQNNLLRESAIIPYPVAYETNTDLSWTKDQRGHLLVKFNGLSKHQFEIRCDRRQLHWFQRFWEVQQTYKQDPNKYSSALFTLRSARLLWREKEGKGNPWEVHQLYLQCSIDTRFWTAEGTNQIAQEKNLKTKEKIDKLKEKAELTPNQLADQKRKLSTLAQKDLKVSRKGESNLGEYLDRLIAKAIVQTAQSYQAETIVLPEMSNIREILYSEVQAKAETKIIGYKKAQKKYAKEYRKNLHQWSYQRLTEYITQLASTEGILIEFGKQPKSGTPQDKARVTALNGYNARLEKSA